MAVTENRLPVKGKRLRRAFGALDGHSVSCYSQIMMVVPTICKSFAFFYTDRPFTQNLGKTPKYQPDECNPQFL